MKVPSAQTVFNKVAKHLLTQNAKSNRTIDGETTCAYRGSKGRACGVGCLITDKEYNKEWECAAVQMLLDDFRDGPNKLPKRLKVLFTEHEDLLIGLQQVHDDYHPNQWANVLAETAEKHCLKMPK